MLVQRIINKLGYMKLKSKGDSMLPTIKPGNTLTIKKVNPKALCLGDVVLFQEGNSYISHRIVKMEREKVMTKGDNNKLCDFSILRKDIIGIITFIETVTFKQEA